MPILCHPFQRTVNTSSIAFYRLNQPSLTIFVLAVAVFSYSIHSSCDDCNYSSPASSNDCQFQLNNFSAWLYVYHCSTRPMRCVIICTSLLVAAAVPKRQWYRPSRIQFLPARRYASAGLCDSNVSVCLSACHTPLLYQNEER